MQMAKPQIIWKESVTVKTALICHMIRPTINLPHYWAKFRGGGGRLSFGRGGAAGMAGGGGVKTWPYFKPLGTEKKIHPVTICIPCTGIRTDSLFCCVSSYIHKNLLRPTRAVAGAEIASLS